MAQGHYSKPTQDVVQRVRPLLERLATRTIDRARLLQYLSAMAGVDWGVFRLRDRFLEGGVETLVLEEGDRVVFLRRVVPGGADRSYGIHVAQLAGLPRAVVRRAREVLTDLEQGGGKPAGGRSRRATPAQPPPTFQLSLFGATHPVVDELRALDVESLSPLEAITKLYELKGRAKEG